MADEMEQTPTPGSSGQANQTLGAEQGENQQADATASTGASPDGQEGQPNSFDSVPDWNGNDVESLPKPLQSRATGMLRYFHSKTQELAEKQRKADEVLRLTQDPVYQEFLKARQGGQASSIPQQPVATPESLPVEITPDEIALATTGDPNAFQSVVMKAIGPAAQQLMSEVQQLKQELTVSKFERELDAFTSVHPDFYTIPQPIMKAAMQEALQSGGGLEQAYERAKEIEKQYYEKANAKIADKVRAKKAAVTASPSQAHEPTFIEVDSLAEQKRLSAEMAFQGKRVDVRVRKKG